MLASFFFKRQTGRGGNCFYVSECSVGYFHEKSHHNRLISTELFFNSLKKNLCSCLMQEETKNSESKRSYVLQKTLALTTDLLISRGPELGEQMLSSLS